jgi:flagellar FliL protein
MAVIDAETDGKKKKKGGLLVPLLVGVVLAVLAGGGGYWAVTSGPLAPEVEERSEDTTEPEAAEMAPTDSVFVSLDPVVITLGPEIAGRHLMFTAYLEVPPNHEEEVTRLIPRVLDVLNGYLRVIELSELSDPTSLAVLRAQMLRRIQTVTGPGRVDDLLVTQFVVN